MSGGASSRGVAEERAFALERGEASASFSFQSLGDRVHGRVARAKSGDRAPLVLLATPDGSATNALFEAGARAWGDRATLASIDLPLCGRRASDKLSHVVLEGRSAHPLRREIERQAHVDLAAARDALGASAACDAGRVALVACAPHGLLAREFWLEEPLAALVLVGRNVRTGAAPGRLAADAVRTVASPRGERWLAGVAAFLAERLRS